MNLSNKKRRKYISLVESDEERIESDDNSQFKVVIYNPSSDLDNLCENIKNNVHLSRFTHFEFDKLRKIEINKVEEYVYAMMETFNVTPIEIANSLPKSLYDRVGQRWKYSLTIEKNIR